MDSVWISSKYGRAADCQSAKQQAASLRYEFSAVSAHLLLRDALF